MATYETRDEWQAAQGGGTPVSLEIKTADWVTATPTVAGGVISGGTLDGWTFEIPSGTPSGYSEVAGTRWQWTYNDGGLNDGFLGRATTLVPRLGFPTPLVGDFEVIFGVSGTPDVATVTNAWGVCAGYYTASEEHHVFAEFDSTAMQLNGSWTTAIFTVATAGGGVPDARGAAVLYMRLKRVDANVEAAWSTDLASWTTVEADFDVGGSVVQIRLDGWHHDSAGTPTTAYITYIKIEGTAYTP